MVGWRCAYLIGFVTVLFGSPARADEANLDKRRTFSELSLEELLNVPVEVPTQSPRSLRETPGVVTIITRDELLASGARDLIDALHLVPGFAFAVDVQGQVSVGFRGNWGEEGKVLVLLDGQEINETLYLTITFGNHIPIDHIQRIEIMRGPGSVIYGGYAELAVINIITRTAQDLDGASISGTYGQMDRVLGRRSLSLAAGHTFESLDGLGVSVAGLVGEGRRSDLEYQDLFGNAYTLASAKTDPMLFNVGTTYRGLDLRFIFDRYRTTARDAFDESLPKAVRHDFIGYYSEARYRLALTDALTLTPKLSYKRQLPWRVTNLTAGEPVFYDKTSERLLGGLTLCYDPTDWVDLMLGVEAANNRAWLNDIEHVDVGLQRRIGGEIEHSFQSLAVFTQALINHSLANLSLGLRYENNSRFGDALLPRVGITRAWERFHAKVLFSTAFKAPGHENYSLNPNLRPEMATTYELESGYRVNDVLYLGANVFDITIRDPIIFFFDDTGGETYVNFERTGSRGVEGEVKLKHKWGRANARYSFYTARDKNEVDSYAVPGKRDVVRAFPAHTATLDASVPIIAGLSFNPSIVYLSARYGTRVGPEGTAVVGSEAPITLLNGFLLYENLWVDGLDLGAGVHNALDAELRYVQPHDSDHPPLPGPTREYLVRLTYTYDFN